MGVIWEDRRTEEQKQAAQERAVQRRAEWDRHHAANPTHVVVVHARDKTND